MEIVSVELGIIVIAIILAIIAIRGKKKQHPSYPINDCPICGAKDALTNGKCVVCGYDSGKMI
jgi:hypothetical protein